MSLLSEIFKTHKSKSDLDYIGEEIHRSARFGYNFGLIIIDLGTSSKLKNKFSDNVHKIDVLKDYLRPYDRLISEDNNKFCIILPQTDGTGCSIVKERIYNLSQKYQLGNMFIGISIYPHDGTSAVKLLSSAVRHLQNIKENDLNSSIKKVELYD